MSFGFNTNTRSKEDVSLRLKQHNVKRARDETRKLESESRKMEEKLTELRLAMNREKEEREKQGGGYWSRGQTGNLNNYATDVLNKPSSSSSKGSSPGKRKVKVLKDTPLDVPDRPSQPGTMAFLAKQNPSTTPKQKVKGHKCGQCEEKKAAVSCIQCSELYCPGCFAAFHLKGALKKHRSVPISATGPRQCMSPRPTPPVSNRDLDYSHPPPEGAVHPTNSYIQRVRFQDQDRNSPEGASGSFDGPSLFDGNYNESDSAASFQEALAAWRNGQTEPDTTVPAAPDSVRVLKVETPRVDHGTETKKPPPVEIKFSSNLSYAERLLIKKHRRTEVEEMETPRVGLPTTPRLNFTTSPQDNHPDVETPFTPRSSLTPRIESYPQKSGDQGHEEEEDFVQDDRVNFQALYELSKISSGTTKQERHDADNISIIELDSVTTNPTIEETTQFMVQEVSDLEAWSTARSVKVSENVQDNKIVSKPPRSSKNQPEHKNTVEINDVTMETENPNQAFVKETLKSGKSRPVSAKSRPSSVASRAKSRQEHQRPGSRTRSRAGSRAGSRMEGEGLLTKAPSEGLSMVAQMSADVTTQRSVPLGELFMIGVTPVQQDRIMTPSRVKSAKDNKMRVSNQLYQMAPKSWRPDSSLADNVPSQEVKIEPVEDPFAVAMETDMETGAIHPDTGFIGLSYTDNKTASFEDRNDITPRAPSRSDSLLRDSTLPEFSKIPSRPTTKSKNRSKEFERSPKPSKSFSQDHVMRDVESPGHSSRLSDRISSGKTLTPSPTNEGLSSRARSVLEERAASRLAEDRPASRAVVVDGEDLSSYDNVGDQETQYLDDQETLNKLEWELASESGRITADGQISRMSILPDTDDEESTGSSRSFSRMSQQDQGYDINSRLREDELLDEDEDDLDDEEEVKALH